jgi:alkyl sulfatase BDS1-like metallo-beta-lactamase superfamily hydrolase
MPGTATEFTQRRMQDAVATLPMSDRQDFEDARRGFLGSLEDPSIRDAAGREVWNLEAYAFLDAECPPTAHPSLWRQGQLTSIAGLFEIVPGIFQVRGFDLSNVTFVEGTDGVIVIDPLISTETAAAALGLYRAHRCDPRVTREIYTHSHVDHFGGVEGVISQAEVDAGVPVVAPAHFLEHAVSENVYAGAAMTRRAGYMYGAALEKGPAGQIGAGLGQTTSTGTVTLIVPTVDVTHTGQELTLDGVRIEFQLTPGTEAPSEMNFYFPDHRALCMAENATHNLHNILTLRGAVVRDARQWAAYLGEAAALYGDRSDVAFASHHWPTWGQERATDYLLTQRDLYAYLHDQTLRMLNQGFVGSEIAEMIELPPAFEAAWHTHGYYGSVSHNVKAIYQRYMGWYDGNPAHLWQHPPQTVAKRYVTAMGGAAAALDTARTAFDEGDYRWAVEVLDHVLFADPANQDARSLQSDAFEQLGFGAENGTWRSAFLAGATELRSGNFGTPAVTSSPGMVAALTVSQLLDSVAVRVDGPRAWHAHLVFSLEIVGDATYLAELRNGALTHRVVDAPVPDEPAFVLTKAQLIGLLGGAIDLPSAIESGDIAVTGDRTVLAQLVGFLADVDPGFDIVTP